MKILFRTDASVEIGSGHVVRCLTLADSLRDRGAKCEFVCSEIKGNLIDLIESSGYQIYKISPSVKAGDKRIANHTEAFFPWSSDAKKTIETIRPGAFYDWLVVDHYALDANWEVLLHGISNKLMVIDDLANRPHSCSLLVDQNYEDEDRYLGLVPENCITLLGPKYALLRPEYAAARDVKNKVMGDITSVLIYFGGSDLSNMTEKCLLAMSADDLAHLSVDIVVGASYSHHESLLSMSAHRGGVKIYKSLPHLADLMVKADLAIGGGGVTSWERLCVGLPSLVVSQAQNQIPISQILHQRSMINLLNINVDISVDDIRNAILDEMKTKRISKTMNEAMKLCDGLGVNRVIESMNLENNNA